MRDDDFALPKGHEAGRHFYARAHSFEKTASPSNGYSNNDRFLFELARPTKRVEHLDC